MDTPCPTGRGRGGGRGSGWGWGRGLLPHSLKSNGTLCLASIMYYALPYRSGKERECREKRVERVLQVEGVGRV